MAISLGIYPIFRQTQMKQSVRSKDTCPKNSQKPRDRIHISYIRRIQTSNSQQRWFVLMTADLAHTLVLWWKTASTGARHPQASLIDQGWPSRRVTCQAVSLGIHWPSTYWKRNDHKICQSMHFPYWIETGFKNIQMQPIELGWTRSCSAFSMLLTPLSRCPTRSAVHTFSSKARRLRSLRKVHMWRKLSLMNLKINITLW